MAVLERGNQVGDLAVEFGHGSRFLAFGGNFLKYADGNGDAADQDDQAQGGVGDGQPVSRWIAHSERPLLREAWMHGWGHIEIKGVVYRYLRCVTERQTEWSGFPTTVPLGFVGFVGFDVSTEIIVNKVLLGWFGNFGIHAVDGAARRLPFPFEL